MLFEPEKDRKDVGRLLKTPFHKRALPRDPRDLMMVAPSLRSRNFIYGGGLFLLVAGFAGVPLLISHRRSVEGTSPLTTQGKPLVGHQLMRGAYNNHGSKDVGPDPDWNGSTKMWKGDGKSRFNPSPEDILFHRKQLEITLREKGLKKD